MTDLETQVQERAEKHTCCHFAGEVCDAKPVHLAAIRESWKLGRKQALEEAARLCDTWQLFFPGRKDISEAGDEVADKLGAEIRRLIESED